jgi:hypothetical protein
MNFDIGLLDRAMEPLRHTPRFWTFAIGRDRELNRHGARDFAAFVATDPVGDYPDRRVRAFYEMAATVFVAGAVVTDVTQQRDIKLRLTLERHSR